MKKLLFIISLLFTGSIYAQTTLTDYIPKNTTYLFSVNFAQLNAKSKGMDYTKYLKSFVKTRNTNYFYPEEPAKCELLALDKVLENPVVYGIDIKTNVYIYTTWINEIKGTVYIFRLDKPEAFESQLNTACQPASMIQKRHIQQATVFVSDNVSVAINGNIGLIFRKEYSYSPYSYESSIESTNDFRDSAYQAESAEDNLKTDRMFLDYLNSHKNLDYDKEQENFMKKGDTTIAYRAKLRMEERINEENTKKFNAIFDLLEKLIIPQQENMSSDRNFLKLDQGKHDAYVFLNVLSNFNSEMFSAFYRYGMFETDPQAPAAKRVLTENLSSSYSINFEDGKATMNTSTSYNKHVAPYMEKIYGVKQDKNLFKYIDGENLLGYVSMAVNAKEMAIFYEDFYREMMQSFQTKESSKDIFTGMELFYAILDKEMLFNSLNGRTMIACTGFGDIKVKYTTYDYDEEFKKLEKTEERVEKQPKIVWVSSLGNKENAHKLFEIISRFSVFKKLKNNVFAYYGTEYNPINVYLAITEDAFIVTNDANLVLNNLEGFPKNRQISKTDQKLISQHNILLKIYGQKMLEGVNDTYFKNGETLPWFTQLMSSMGDIELYDTKPTETSYSSTAVVTLKDSSSNALYQLLKMMSSANDR